MGRDVAVRLGRGTFMPSYRLYFLNEQGRIIRAENIDAIDDDGARRTAKILDHAYEIEIWEQSRMVDTVRTGDAGTPT